MTRRKTRLRRWTLRVAIALAIVAGLATLAVGALAVTNPRLLLAAAYFEDPTNYTVPVAGVRATALRSTWGAPRSGGRRHRGVDIFAPRGTPVVSAVDGVVWHVGTNPLGGRVVWIVGEGASLYYYAHLDEWAPGLASGDRVRAGDVVGSVGNTGNARTTPSHLHFSINRLSLGGLLGVDPVPVLAGARTVPVAATVGVARAFERQVLR